MTSAPRGRNSVAAERIESWEWQAPAPLSVSSTDSPNEPEDFFENFDLEAHWERGGFRASLFAGTDSESAAFLDRLIATDLVTMPSATSKGHPIDRSSLLRALARYNGSPLESLRRQLSWDKQSFAVIVEHLVNVDLIFTLPFLPEDGRSALYYFCDTGVLHRLFSPRMRQAGLTGPHRAKSWEGFVIRTICQRFGKDADAWVFRDAETHEIDLVLRWPDTSECWAIEIGAGTDKRPSVGFWKGIDMVSATNLIVIHRGRRDEIGECQRMTLAQLLTEY